MIVPPPGDGRARKEKRKAEVFPEVENQRVTVLRHPPDKYYAFVREYEEETWRGRIVRLHLELECIKAAWFDATEPYFPAIDQVALVSDMFYTTVVASPGEMVGINNALHEPNDVLPQLDIGDLQPAHLHEGNWIVAIFHRHDGLPVILRRAASPNPATIVVSPVESISYLFRFGRVRPPSKLVSLQNFSNG